MTVVCKRPRRVVLLHQAVIRQQPQVAPDGVLRHVVVRRQCRHFDPSVRTQGWAISCCRSCAKRGGVDAARGAADCLMVSPIFAETCDSSTIVPVDQPVDCPSRMNSAAASSLRSVAIESGFLTARWPRVRGVNNAPELSVNAGARLRAARWATAARSFPRSASARHLGACTSRGESPLRAQRERTLDGAAGDRSRSGPVPDVGRQDRRGAGRALVVLLAGLVICAALALVVNVNSMFALIPLMLAFGGAKRLFDVSINARHGTGSASGKRVMQHFHGMYSVVRHGGAVWARF